MSDMGQITDADSNAIDALTDEDIEAGRLLFAGECTFLAASNSMKNLAPMARDEVAFAGRSNVGKSSLVNALTGRKTLARTSQTPGRTRQLIFFKLVFRNFLGFFPTNFLRFFLGNFLRNFLGNFLGIS